MRRWKRCLFATLDAARTRLVTRLAQQRRLTAYDAAYLAAAMTSDLPLASLDKDLREAARTEGVTLWPSTI